MFTRTLAFVGGHMKNAQAKPNKLFIVTLHLSIRKSWAILLK